MSTITYNKLVRDKIPEIIRSDGKQCTTEILSDDEFLKMVDAKLDEELAEYHKDKNIEELADLLEVVYAAAMARGYSVEELYCSVESLVVSSFPVTDSRNGYYPWH